MVWYATSSRSNRNIRRGRVTKQDISRVICKALVPESDENVAGRATLGLGAPLLPCNAVMHGLFISRVTDACEEEPDLD